MAGESGFGRPPIYDEETATELLSMMSSGKSLRQSVRELTAAREGTDLPPVPQESTVRMWSVLDDPPGFRARYADARAAMMDAWAEDIVEISDTTQTGEKTRTYVNGDKEDVTEVQTADMIEHRKLQIDTRKWLMARIGHQTYGDRSKTEHSGTIGTRQEPVTKEQALERLRELGIDPPLEE